MLITITLLSLAFQYEPLGTQLQWNREALAQGEMWRLFTGHFTHSNLSHFALNLSALWIIVSIFRPTVYRLSATSLIVAIVIGLFLHQTHYTTYVGLSGVLHGLIATFSLKEALNGEKSSYLLLAGVVIKVVLESAYTTTNADVLIGIPVAYEAHIIGVVCGISLAIIEHLRQKYLTKQIR